MATVLVGLAFIEHMLGALFYTAGRYDLEHASISKLLKEALNNDWIAQTEYEKIEQVRKIRNPVTHFRKPFDDDNIDNRLVAENKPPYQIIEQDAYSVMETVLHLMSNSLFSATENDIE